MKQRRKHSNHFSKCKKRHLYGELHPICGNGAAMLVYLYMTALVHVGWKELSDESSSSSLRHPVHTPFVLWTADRENERERKKVLRRMRRREETHYARKRDSLWKEQWKQKKLYARVLERCTAIVTVLMFPYRNIFSCTPNENRKKKF